MAYSVDIKEQLDMRLLPWPDVTSRQMFGGVCYLHQGRMFAIIHDDSVVIKLPDGERRDAIENHAGREFSIGNGRTFGQWTEFPGIAVSNIAILEPLLNTGYRYAMSLTSTEGNKKNSKRKKARR